MCLSHLVRGPAFKVKVISKPTKVFKVICMPIWGHPSSGANGEQPENWGEALAFGFRMDPLAWGNPEGGTKCNCDLWCLASR